MAEHAPVAGVSIEGGVLAFDGHPIVALAERLGRTPFYVHSTAALGRRAALARSVLPAGAQLHYAVKANPFAPVVRWFARHADGADVASAGEMRLAVACGFAPGHIGFAGPGKRADEVREAVAMGVTVTAESMLQLQAVAAAARAGGPGGRAVPAQAAIRVNPAHELRASAVRMGGGPSAFGIDEEQLPEALALADALGVRVVGLHFYPGSQNLRGEAVADAMRANAAAAQRLMQGRPDWGWLNLGGGLGVPYAAGEREIDLVPVAAALADIDAALAARAAPQAARPTLRIELGRYLVADAGIYVCRVIDRKVSRGRTVVVTDGGLHHNQSATGNFGQVIKRPYPLLNASRPQAAPEAVDLVGPLCTPMDAFGRNVPIAQPQVGDLIAVLRSGAYGRSASPIGFLGHEDCQELLVPEHGPAVVTSPVAAPDAAPHPLPR